MANWKGSTRNTPHDRTRNTIGALSRWLADLQRIPYDSDKAAQWKRNARLLLEGHFPPDHELIKAWHALTFGNLPAGASPEERAKNFVEDAAEGCRILASAHTVWFTIEPPVEKIDSRSPLVSVVNTNNNHASSWSFASSESNLNVSQLLSLVDSLDSVPEQQKAEAREAIEDLDGELRKEQPRWEKIKKLLTPLLELGKDVGVQVLVPVVTRLVLGNGETPG